MSKPNRAELLATYRDGPLTLRGTLARVPRENWDYRPGPERWTIREIVMHLADAEVQSHVRCRMIIAEPGALIPNHDEHRWSTALNYANGDLDAAVELISLVRRVNHDLLTRLPEDAWTRSAVHAVRGEITLDDWLSTYAAHLPRHLEQIRRNEEARGTASSTGGSGADSGRPGALPG